MCGKMAVDHCVGMKESDFLPHTAGNLSGRDDFLRIHLKKGQNMSSIIDHVTLGVSDIESARRLYDRVMPTLGFRCLWENPSMIAYGIEGADDFGLQSDVDGSSRRGTHVAFRAPDRASVNRFHSEALAAGARDDGAPGLRPEYHDSYYAAFVIDSDGNRIEAVCHEPAES
jgi:catechol 2,3-dioxygenase-like lactoylglutathione lyase family enzyme